MSTGLNCEFFEYEPGKWYYCLEAWNSPKTAWDWTEDANVVGPFPTFEEANTYLHRNNANPGGHTESPYCTKGPLRRPKSQQDEYAKLVARAERPI